MMWSCLQIILVLFSTVFAQLELAKNIHLRHDLIQGARVSGSFVHQVTFAVKQRNLDVLSSKLTEVSTPGPMYGKYLSREEVGALTSNPEATQEIVDYLLANYETIQIVEISKYGEYIVVSGPIFVFEELFSARFFNFHQFDPESGREFPEFSRALSYTIPAPLLSFVEAVFNVVDFPSSALVYRNLSPNKSTRRNDKTQSTAETSTPWVDVQFINEYYKVDSNTGSTAVAQYVYGALEQYYSVADLLAFEHEEISPTYSQVPVDVGGDVMLGPCSEIGGECTEANLDVQFMMGVSQVTPTTFFYSTLGFVGFLFQFANYSHPYGSVISFSYAELEQFVTVAEMNAFNTEAKKLGVQGTSLVCSSGDDGAIGYIARLNPAYCGYTPFFPGVSPFMTVVGGTMGGPNGLPEVACQADIFPDGYQPEITTGGGFSYMNPLPSYQSQVVATYFATSTSYPGYATNGRGYPDVSLVSMLYEVYFNYTAYPIAGTSASTPVFAAFLSLINAARNATSLPPVGFANPMIYSYFQSFLLNDITSGSNNCGAFAYVCCEQGYSAVPGWDPLTGLGSVNFTAMKETFLDPTKLYANVNAAKDEQSDSSNGNFVVPTAQPTRAPGWVSFTIFDQDTCDSQSNVVSIQSFQTGKCFQKFNTTGLPSGSYRYECAETVHSNNPQVVVTHFSDQLCLQSQPYPDVFSVGGCSNFGNISYGFEMYADLYDGYVAAQMLCNVTSAITPSLPEGNFVTSSLFNANQCFDITGYSAYREGHCFQTGVLQESSYKYIWPNLYEYSDYKCSPDTIVKVTALVSVCVEQMVNYDDYSTFPLDYSSASQQFQYVESSPPATDTDDSDSNGLSDSAVAGVVIAVFIVIIFAVALLQFLRPSLFARDGGIGKHAGHTTATGSPATKLLDEDNGYDMMVSRH